MTREVRVTLTTAEADALSYAAGNTTSAPDAMEALFATRAKRDTCYRAHTKLDAAIRAARHEGQRRTRRRMDRRPGT